MPYSKVPVGTYNIKGDSIGDQAKLEQYRLKIQSKMGSNYNMLKIEDKNRQWIDTARKEYMPKSEEQKGHESVN
jgi:hypothetical protein